MNGGIIAVPLIGGFILFFIINLLVKAPGRVLRAKFVATNPLKGKPMAEIIARCGQPQSRSGIRANNTRLFQWQVTGYHIALLVDANDICQGVTHEYTAR